MILIQCKFFLQSGADLTETNLNLTGVNLSNATEANSTDFSVSTNGSTAGNTTFIVNNPNNNTANWVGFNKLTQGQNLMQLLSGYIVYIVALTIYNLILLNQQRKR